MKEDGQGILSPEEEIQLPVMPPILDGQNQSDPNLFRHYVIPDQEGYYHIEDMRFIEHQYKLFFGTEEEQELARNAINSKSKRWPHGVLPYKFNPSVTAANQKKIKNCMAKFNTHFQNCINVRYLLTSIGSFVSYNLYFAFREKTSTDIHFVAITPWYTGCWSPVGKQGGRQELNLQPGYPGCMDCRFVWDIISIIMSLHEVICKFNHSSRTIMHEFMHALGLYHTQSRPDRDDYVEIKWDNIQKEMQYAYYKCKDCSTYDVGYDAKSIMH